MHHPKAFFISDLHLSKNLPQVASLFHYFLDHIVKPGDTLYILGDFFEYWLGADLADSVQENALLKLKALQAQGSPIYFIHGNRDFLIKKKTLAQYGITLLNDPSLITLFNKRILISHGDYLCTLDKIYQRYRKLTRLPFIQHVFLCLPRRIRIFIAERIHAQNPHGQMLKEEGYKLADATPEAIHQALDHYHPDLFIYGHVHRSGDYRHGTRRRMVLADWYHTGNYIEITENSITARVFSLNP